MLLGITFWARTACNLFSISFCKALVPALCCFSAFAKASLMKSSASALVHSADIFELVLSERLNVLIFELLNVGSV